MKKLSAGICLVITQIAQAQTPCIPSTFAEDDLMPSYQKMTEDKRAALAAVQKEYAEFAEQVRRKKGRDNQIELTNAFVDAAGMAYMIHAGLKMFEMKTILSLITSDADALMNDLGLYEAGVGGGPAKFKANLRNYVQGLDEQKKAVLRKQLGKRYEDKIVNRFDNLSSLMKAVSEFGEAADEQGLNKTLSEKIKGWFNFPKRIKGWFDNMKGLALGEQMKKTVFTAGKKIGFASFVMMVPLGIYVTIAKISEQQRLVKLTAEQDKVMKQALLLELFLNQKSFAELAATRAKLTPKKVCPA